MVAFAAAAAAAGERPRKMCEQAAVATQRCHSVSEAVQQHQQQHQPVEAQQGATPELELGQAKVHK